MVTVAVRLKHAEIDGVGFGAKRRAMAIIERYRQDKGLRPAEAVGV